MERAPGREQRIARRVRVAGRVQGVGFRMSCYRMAHELGVAGSVRNLDDGRVEVLAEGRPAAVDGLIRWCRRGPRHAMVTAVTVDDQPVTGLSAFTVDSSGWG